MFQWLQRRRWKRITSQPFPESWESILTARVRQYACMNEALQKRLRECVQILIAERDFEGCGGLHLTDEVKVTISGNASLLLLGVKDYYFDGVPSILVYPQSYTRPGGANNGLIVDEDQAFAGEAWRGGPIVLSWRDIVHGAHSLGRASNVVVHEFTHHLDGLDGEMGGTPPMDRSLQSRWSPLLSREYNQLVESLSQGRNVFLDPYAATNQAEFLAVTSEFFFEQPVDLKIHHPDWYELLSEYYHLDPAQWDCTW